MMITTFREAQCLLMLYHACPDAEVRARALRLVPELAEVVDTATLARPARRRRLTAYRLDGPTGYIVDELGHDHVICRDDEVEEHERNYAAKFSFAYVKVETKDA